jgi:hypothetical protein
MGANVKLRCSSCRHEMPLPPHKCPQCGGEMVVTKPRWQPSPIVVIFLLFFVLGPFALGILWRNERFSTDAKWFLTVVAIICWIPVMWYFYAEMRQIYVAVLQAMKAMSESPDQLQF